MTSWITVLAAKPDDPSLIPRSNMMEKETDFAKLLSDLHPHHNI